MDRIKKKAKTHTVYKTKDGKRVCGVTTITGILDKPALKIWANKIGLQGIEMGKYVDELATIGTLIHYMVECHLKRIKPDLSDYSPNQVDTAENGFLKFLEWEKKNPYEFVASELALVSEKKRYGGTIDAILKIEGKLVLVDFKSSKGIFPEHHLQVVGGYLPLARENGYLVEEARIIRIGRDESEGFDDIACNNLDLNEELFDHCRAVYELRKMLNRR